MVKKALMKNWMLCEFYCQLLLDPDPDQGEPNRCGSISGSSVLLPESAFGSRQHMCPVVLFSSDFFCKKLRGSGSSWKRFSNTAKRSVSCSALARCGFERIILFGTRLQQFDFRIVFRCLLFFFFLRKNKFLLRAGNRWFYCIVQ